MGESWRKPGAQAGRSPEGTGGVWGHTGMELLVMCGTYIILADSLLISKRF